MPRMILSLAPASALHSISAGRHSRDPSSVAAPQLPRTRRLADCSALARLHARQLVWEWGLNGLAAFHDPGNRP